MKKLLTAYYFIKNTLHCLVITINLNYANTLFYICEDGNEKILIIIIKDLSSISMLKLSCLLFS